MNARRKYSAKSIAACAMATGLFCLPGPPMLAQQPAARLTAAQQPAWTLDEARSHLRLYPRDAYVQYVALQLAQREGRVAEIAAEIDRLARVPNQFAARRGQVDLFSIFSGSLAVQESLQLDAFAADGVSGVMQPVDVPVGRSGPRPVEADRAGRRAAAPRGDVAVSELEGPTIKSHPWTEMLAGRQPAVTGLALQTPADFYFVRFGSVNKLLEASELSIKWGAHVLNQSAKEAETQLVDQRLREQLAVEVSPLLRPFYDAMAAEIAIVGSDLFVREGSDVTLLFRVKQPALFRAKMDEFLNNADAARPDAVRSKGQYLGVDWDHVATPDRRVHVYSAYPSPELHVRSNSQAALERVLAAIAGRDAAGQPVTRLGETDEFRYVRTLMPEGAAEEDGLVYLSDPFIRRLMGPALRLTERRRQACYNHLRMIGHAALMCRTQKGHSAASLAELHQQKFAPGAFGEGKLACPEGGAYSLAADGLTGVCSHHGYASYITPCTEIMTTHVTEAEAEAYKRFLAEYNSYWRQFFDPIAIRLQITPERYRAETIVLPLIDNSIYTVLAQALGGKPEPLDALPVPKRSIFSVAVKLDKARLLRDYGLEQFIDLDEPERDDLVASAAANRATDSLGNLALAMLNFESAHKSFPAPSKNGLSWRVELLPFLNEQPLYSEFRRNEPWDSEHNRRLIARMPAIFQSGNAELDAAGKTRFVASRGQRAAFPSDDRGIQLRQMADGISNTAMLFEADDEHAVVWTKPDDIELDPRDAANDLEIRPPGAFLVAMADGRVVRLRREITPADLEALLTSSGGETVNWQALDVTPIDRRSRGPLGIHEAQVIADLRLGELLTKGVGNQIGFHVYDSEPMFDLSLAQFMGMALGSMRGRIDDDFLFLFPLVSALNGPVYASIPVQDGEIVDGFLDRLDKHLVELAQQDEWGGFFSFEQDFYQLPADGERAVRAYGFRFGPLKWRFFWSRIGDAVYIASKRDVLDDIAALAPAGDVDNGAATAAHGLVRLRPQNWDQVLGAYRLGWEENSREACLRNLGPLASLSRALVAADVAPADVSADLLNQHTARLYDVHYFCPDGGRYDVGSDGRDVTCSIHGSAAQPRQGTSPSPASELGQLLQQFRDMNITLTFLEDGLHAVATIERELPGR